jgi:hypothetical protein
MDPLLTPTQETDVDEVTTYGYGGIPLDDVPGTTDLPLVSRPGEYREYSTLGEKVGEIPTGLLQGAVEGTPVGVGLTGGLALGMLAAPYTGPFAPLTVVVGGGLGLAAGLQGEDAVKALIDKYNLFPAPGRPDLDPFREGAKTTGGALPFVGSVRFLPEMVDNWTSRLLTAYGKSARETPKLFYTVEALGATGSGIGGGVAEAAYPGDPVAKFALEFGGGAFFPFRTIVSNFGEAKNVKNSFKEMFGEGKAESRAAKRLFTIFNDPYVLETFKEDPQQVLAALRSPEISGLRGDALPTAAQKSGSAVLSAFEASLAKQSAQFGGDVESKGRAYMLAHKELVNTLTQTQDPNALLQAAKFQSDYFRDLISTRLKLAQAKIDPLPKGLTPDTPEYRAAIGQQLQKPVVDALSDMRDFEGVLYKKAKAAGYRELTNEDLIRLKVPKKDWAATRAKMVTFKQQKPSSLIYEVLDILEDRGMSGGKTVLNDDTLRRLEELGLDEDMVNTYNGATLSRQFRETTVLPPEITSEIDGKIKMLPPGQLQNFRKDMLRLARYAKAGSERGDAEVYGRLAQAALKDLEAFDIPEYKEAITFSRTLNDYFTRAFPVEITASKRSGAQKNPPELLVDGFFQTLNRANDRTSLRMAELEDAVELTSWAKVVDNPKDAAAMRQKWATAVQNGDEATIRELKPLADQVKNSAYVLSVDDAFKKIFEQDIGGLFREVPVQPGQLAKRLSFDTAKYQNFLRQNDALLKRFHPTLYNDLQNVNKAEEYFRYVLDSTSALNKSLQDKSAFAAVLNSPENITRVVSNAFTSGEPVTQLQRLINLATNKKVLQKTGLGDAPKRGLASSLYDWAFMKAAPEPAGPARDTAVFDPAAFKSAMFSPIQPNQPSLSELMVKNGLVDVAEMVRLEKIVKVIQKTQDSMGTRRFVETLNTINPLEDLAIRLAGTNVTSQIAPSGPGALVAAGAGVRTFKKLFEDMPLGKTRAVLERAAKDPAFMATLLERGKAYDQRSFFNIGKRVIESMKRNGLAPLSVATMNYFDQSDPPPTDEEVEEMLISPTTGAPASQLLRQLPPAPPTTGLPFMSSARAAQPGPAAPGPGPAAPAPQGQPQGSSRQMLQSLFPFDTTLQLPQ